MANDGSMTFTELLKSNDPDVYLLNTSDRINGEMRGDINISVDVGNSTEILIIPNTWIPVEATGQFSKEQLVASQQLRRMVNQRYVAILTPEKARQILGTEDAQAEATRLLYKAGNAIPERFAAETELDNVKPAIMQIMENANLPTPQKLAALRNVQNIMTEDDLRYVLSKCGDSPENEQIRNFVIKTQQLLK